MPEKEIERTKTLLVGLIAFVHILIGVAALFA